MPTKTTPVLCGFVSFLALTLLTIVDIRRGFLFTSYAARVNVDWLTAFGVSGWMRPAAQATSYLLTVWHATMIGILISGLTLTVLTRWIEPYFVRQGLGGSLFGALFALPQPFCSCCSSVMAPSLVRRGASTNFILAFVLGAPLLNVTTIVLAIALLPAPFAVLRIAGGVGIA